MTMKSHDGIIKANQHRKDGYGMTKEDEAYTLADQAAAAYREKCNSYIHATKANGFYQRAAARGEKGAVKTGFKGLDDILAGGLYSGLYVIGGGTSIGKTAFMLQIADNIARSGRDILYFSLEMEHDELISRTLSRLTYEKFGRNAAVTATEAYLWRGKGGKDITTTLSTVFDTYVENIAPHHYVFQGDSKTNIEVIKDIVNTHKEAAEISAQPMDTPVIFIDYMQIIGITPYTDINGVLRYPNQTDKQKIDTIMQDLKTMSRDLDTPVVVVSSYNRGGYSKGADFSSFKDSGSVEYGCDVLIGLQYAGTGKEGQENKVARQMQRLNSEDFAEVEAVILKNRKGKKNVTCSFMFNAAYNIYLNKADDPQST